VSYPVCLEKKVLGYFNADVGVPEYLSLLTLLVDVCCTTEIRKRGCRLSSVAIGRHVRKEGSCFEVKCLKICLERLL
jgi:hypothetical protein